MIITYISSRRILFRGEDNLKKNFNQKYDLYCGPGREVPRTRVRVRFKARKRNKNGYFSVVFYMLTQSGRFGEAEPPDAGTDLE